MPRQARKTVRKRGVRPASVPDKMSADAVADTVADEGMLMGPVEQIDRPAGVFDNIGDDSYVAVFWWSPESKQYEYQGRLETDPTESDIQEFCGGGKYTLREMARDEDSGRMMYRRQRTVKVAGEHFEPKIKRAKGTDDSKPEVHTKGEAPGVAGLTEAITAQIIQLLNQGQAMTKQQMDGITALYDAMRRQADRPQDDTTSKILLAMVQQQTAIMQALLTGKQSDDRPDPIAMVEKIGNVLKAASPSNTGLKEALEAVSAIINLRTDVEGAGPVEDPLVKLATTYIPQFFELARQEKDKEVFVRKARAMLPASTVPEDMHPQQRKPQPEVEMQPWQKMLHAYRKHLLALAQNDTVPEDQATAIVQMMPAPAKAALRNLLSQEGAFEAILNFLPELQPYAQWTASFFQTLHMEFYPDLYDDDGNLKQGVLNVGEVEASDTAESLEGDNP